MAFEQWNETFRQGVQTEDVLRNHFSEAGWRVSGNHNTASYDFAVNTGKFIALVEVKDESRYKGSANIAIEVTQGENKPSGISISESTVVLHYFGEYVVAYRTQAMRLHLRQVRAFRPPKLFKGSDNNNKGVLIPIDSLDVPWFDVVSLDGLVKSGVWSP